MANLLYPASTGHYTDDKYSPLVEPNLFANNIFQPGITFTDKYQLGAAGQIFVHKPGVGTITPTAPGADFSDSIVQDSLITIQLNKQFNRSRKIYGATVASVAYPIAATEIETAVKEIRAAWNLQAVKSLIGESSIKVSDNITTLATASTIYDQIVADRQKLVEAKANPDTIIVSPSVYALLLKSDEFQRTGTIGDAAVADGRVGRIAGLNVVEYESLDDAAANGASIGGITWVAADDELEYVIYDHDAFSIVTSVNATRVVDEPTRFVGTLAQVEIVSGFKLTNPNRALLKFHDKSAS
jgi:hypothetical protein